VIRRFQIQFVLVIVIVFACSLVSINLLNQRLTAFTGNPSLSPGSYVRNAHSVQIVSEQNETYEFTYIFRDHLERDWRWDWSWVKERVLSDSHRFGVPNEIFEPYPVTPEEINRRQGVIREGLFKEVNNYVIPDYNAMVGYYRDYAEPLYQMLVATTGRGNQQARVQTLLKFMQDIPYGIPPDNLNDRVISGLLPPPQLFTEGWGDCDTKAVMMAAILSHSPDTRVLFLTVPRHVLYRSPACAPCRRRNTTTISAVTPI